jgi:glycosyltransferase involved in cell wall biosynthesis
MNFGVPAVATSVGGVVDLMGARLTDHSDLPDVSFWENGLTVRSRDSKAYADAIQFMLTNEVARNLCGTKARRFIEENFSKQRFLRDIANLYREMLG